MEIYLRDLRLTDVDDIHSYSSIDEVSQYQVWGPNIFEQTQTHIKDVLNRDNTIYHKVIVLKQNQRVIGAAQMTLDEDNKNAGVGYIVHPEYWGHGIATKVARQLLDYGFNELELNRIWATTDKRNIGSEKVLLKIGMIKEGLLRQNIKLGSGYRDTLIYSILQEEYNSK